MVSLLERKLKKYLPVVSEGTKRELESIIEEENKNRRQPAPPAPKGGISLSAASRKYKVIHQTISRWVKKGLVPELMRTKREVYVDESKLAALVEKYLKNPGQGKKSVAPDQED